MIRHWPVFSPDLNPCDRYVLYPINEMCLAAEYTQMLLSKTNYNWALSDVCHVLKIIIVGKIWENETVNCLNVLIAKPNAQEYGKFIGHRLQNATGWFSTLGPFFVNYFLYSLIRAENYYFNTLTPQVAWR